MSISTAAADPVLRGRSLKSLRSRVAAFTKIDGVYWPKDAYLAKLGLNSDDAKLALAQARVRGQWPDEVLLPQPGRRKGHPLLCTHGR